MDKKNVEAIYPLSPLQKGILFDSLYSPDTLSYFVQIHFDLEQVNVDWFKQAWTEVQQRHPVLRTLFVWENQNQPLQIVLKQLDLNWQIEDWQHDEVAIQNEKLATILQQDKEQGFNLNKAPLMRFYIIRLSINKYHFIWSHHHIILDGWSFPIVLQEVLTIYQAYSQSETPQLATLRSFKDYIQWIQKRDIKQTQSYWTQTLAKITAPTPLAINKTHPNKESLYKEQHFDFTSKIKQKLQIFSREQRITLNTLVQATWALVLGCYSRNQTVLFGSMVSGRPAELQQVETMVGLFANTIPVVVQIDTQQSIKDWLQKLQSEHIEREEFSYQSLIDIQQWSQIPAGTTLFDSVVVTENFPVDASLTDNQVLHIQNFQFSEHANTPLILVFSLYQ
ncbi:MAG: condensation domain-containing protein, partial [Thiotrichaceae bacterium]|nr:condensation domain-containing protein [Thiotrichaceae bacterium]